MATAPNDYIDIVFDGPPGHESGRFVEVESPDGKSINAGQWIDRGDGLWALRIAVAGITDGQVWLQRMAEKEANGIISVGGLVNRVEVIEGEGTSAPLTCANCCEVSTNPGQFVPDGRWVCTEKCRKELYAL